MTESNRRIVLRLDEHINSRGWQQKEFAELSGLRPATVSQLVNNKYDRIQLTHLLTVMDALEITDFNEILQIEDTKSNE